MKQNKWFKKAVSGVLAAVTLLSTVVSPMAAVAAELSPEEQLAAYVASLPELDAARDQLDADEIVTAKDYEVEAGAEVDLRTDFTNLEIPDKEKVKVSFYEAKNSDGQAFSTSHADSYHAVYYVEPANAEHPAYRVSRTVTVKEPVETVSSSADGSGGGQESSPDDGGGEDADADPDLQAELTEISLASAGEASAENAGTGTEEMVISVTEENIETLEETVETALVEEAETESEGTVPVEESEALTEGTLPEEALDAALEAAEGQETVDWESGLTLSGVLVWATEEEDIDLAGMEAGETESFSMPRLRSAASNAIQTVDITKGSAYYYADYGLGSYVTYPYTVKFGSVSAVAYCVQPSKAGPGDGVYTITKLSDSKTLAKVCYYGTKASGDEGFFAEKYPDFSAGKRFIITHIAAAYANGSSDAFSGTNSTGQALAMELYNYCVNQPEIPDVAMSFSDDNVTAYKDGNVQRTKEITFKADAQQTITMKLPDGVKLHNVTTGKTSAAGVNVEICGGTKFYLSAPLTQVSDVAGSWFATMKGSITKDYSAYKITTGSDTQDLALVFGEGVDDEKYVDFKVTWLALANIYITKTDAASGKNLAGAVFGIYSDAACTNLIAQMPATDANGSSTVEIIVTQDTVYLKEITAPKGYAYSASAQNVKVVAGQDSKVTVPNQEIMGQLTVYKEGEVLTGASVAEDGVTFQYGKKRLAGAAYQVTAGADIIAADGTLVYKKGAVVAEKLVTGSDGSATLGGLHLGSYLVTETGAPKNYTNKGESKTVTLTETDPTQELVLGELTFTNDRQKVEVSAEKKDKLTSTALPGAVYGLYAGEDIKDYAGAVAVGKDALIAKATTGSDGTAAFHADIPIGYRYYVKELAAPTGFRLNGSDTYSFTASYTNEKEAEIRFSHTFENEEIRGELTIYKEGEVLTGVTTSDGGVAFQYEARRQPGASFNVYAGAEIKSAGGKAIYQKGDLVAENLVTGADGSVTLTGLFLGTYTVKETGAPENFVTAGGSKDITLSLASLSGEAVMASVTFQNDRQKVSVAVNKVDDTTKNPLKGGIYGLFAGETIRNADGDAILQKDTLIQKATTGADGKAAFTADLPLNASYYVKELQAPAKYVRNEADVFTFRTDYTTDTEPVIGFSHTFENERVNARIDLVKKDAETGAKTQGDASLAGASYGLYAREDIIHPDGKTGVIYKKGTQIATLTTDKEGKASIGDLYLGKYYLKELVPSEGYLLDETEHDLDCADEGDMVKTVKKSAVSNEQVIKQPFQVIKAANNGKTDADLLSGVGFTAYLISTLKQNADGSYDFTGADPVVITEDGKTEMFTDERGHAQSIALPYGKYIVRETTTPHNFTPVKDFTVTVCENHPTEPQVWRVLLDEEFEAKLKIVKKDDGTKKPVLLAGTEFKVYDMEKEAYVEQVTTYPKTVVHTSYFTDENGFLILPENLLPGHYRIEEVTAPQGYTVNPDGVEVLVDSNTAYEMDSVSGDAIITVEMENKAVKGELTIIKKGEVLAGYGKDFSYQVQTLAGAEFAVYAAEDIYTPDHQKDADGNRMVVYAKDALVAAAVTDENGKAVVEGLPLGSYYVKETKAPEGFVLNREMQGVAFAWQGQDTPVVSQTAEFTNDRQKVSISVEKQDASTGAKVGGATFGLYAKEEIKAGGKVLVKADALLEEAVSDENGTAAFTLDLPLGRYYVKETKAPDGFVSSDEVLDFDAAYRGQDVPAVRLNAVKKNKPTTVEITKSDLTTGVELDGAELTVLDKEGNVIDRWTSVKGEPHVIRYLTTGESYVLREEFAPYGYLKAEEVVFTVADTAEIQKVEMKDEVPTALLIINKKGEFLDNVSLLENAKGIVEHLFEYVTGSLTEVTFEVYAAEDILAADGVSGDYYKKDDLVGTITTGDNGTATLGGLPLGKYYVKEAKTAYGYVLDGEPRYVDLTYRGQDTPVVTYDENWQNSRQKVSVHVLKVEKETGTPLAGGIFGLFAGEDILSASGKVLMEKDTLIELKTTDSDGKIGFTADLPVDGKYYVQEQYAPAGYVTDHEKREFTFEYGGEDMEIAVYEFTFENEPTTVEFTKSDLATGEELPGAHLEVRDGDGNLVDAWVSTGEPHTIQKLEAGKEYTLIETLPADGYVTAESITFQVGDTAEVQKVVMEDDVTKVEISKTDMATGKELPGAKLVILDADGNVVESWISGEEPHYIEKLPVGEYTLREETAPDGYVRAEAVKFTVEDTGEIQKVEMKDDFTKVEISKTDMATGKELPGAKLTILDADGNVVESWVSGEEPHYIEKLPVGEYTLREETAPDGYQKAEDVRFTVEETGEIQKAEMKDAPVTPTETPSVPDTPKTGDDSRPLLWGGLAVLGLLLLGASRVLSKKKRTDKP